MAVGLLVCMFGIENFLQTQSRYFIQNGRTVNIAIGVVVLIATLFSLQRNGFKFESVTRSQVWALILYGFGFLSYYWTIAPDVFRDRWIPSLPYVITLLVLAPIVIREKQVLIGGMRFALIIGFPVLLLSAFYCEWGSRGMILAEPIYLNGILWRETFPLAVASMASTIGIIALAADLRMKSEFEFPFRMLILAVALYVVFLTQSRGQVIALLLTSVIIVFSSSSASGLKGILVVTITLAIMGSVVYYVINTTEANRWDAANFSQAVSYRQNLALELINSWWGKGAGALLVGLGANGSYAEIGLYPHNLPVEILCELGIVGLLIYFYLLKTAIGHGLSVFLILQKLNKPIHNQLMLLGLVIVNFTLSLKEGSLDGWQPLFFFLICLQQHSIHVKGAFDSQIDPLRIRRTNALTSQSATS